MKLSTKLLLVFLLFALLLAPLLGLLVFFSARDAMTSAIARERRIEAQAILNAVDRQIYEAMVGAANIAVNRSVTEALLAPDGSDLRPWRDQLIRDSQTTGPWDLLSIADRDGIVRLSTEARRMGRPLTGREQEVFRRALAEGVAWSDLITLPDAPRPIILIVRRAVAVEGARKGQTIGCVVGRFSWPAVLQLLDEYDGTHVHLLNARGEIIGTPIAEFHDEAFRSVAAHPLVRRKQDVSLAEYSTAGREVVGTLVSERGHLTYRGNGWRLLLESSHDAVYRPIARLARRSVAVVLIFTAFAAALFAIISRRMTRPIRVLNETASAVRGGDLSARAAVSTNDEVGELASTINEMVSTIDGQIHQRRESEAFLESVLDSIPMAISVRDVRDFRAVRVNLATARMMGREPDEFIGRTTSDFFPPDDAKRIRDYEERAVVAGRLEVEGTFSTPLGPKRTRTREVVIRGGDGQPKYLLGITEDITSQYEEERRRQLRLAVAHILAETAAAGAVTSAVIDMIRETLGWSAGLVWRPRNEGDVLSLAGKSPGGDSFSSFMQASAAAQVVRGEGIVGFAWGEGMPRCVERIDQDTYNRAAEALEAGLHSAIAVPIAVGTDVLGVIELLDVQERPCDDGLLSFLQEIGTQVGQYLIRAHTEEELRRAKAAADEASRAKSDFLARMSHEIRTPLNGVIGMTSLLSRTALTREQQEFVRTARSSANLLLSVINDILDFSKIEAGKLTLDDVDFGLRDLMIEAVRPLVMRADDAGVELIVKVAPEVPDALRGDAMRLRQVLVNLAGNAVKFTSAGEIVVSAAVEEERGRELVMRFSVSDTGIGIPRDRLASIFSAFEQADVSTTRRFGGTGLGLAISERLVEMMGGRILVESEEGKGSTFHFTANLVRQEAPAKTAGSAAQLAGLRVLIVDDNATNRMILQAMLESWRTRVAAAAGGREALSILASDAFDIVLLDAHMPDVDGFAVAEKLRESGDRATTIMMLTSASQPADADRIRALGIDVYLTKPVTQSDLLDSIMRARTRERSAEIIPKNVRSPIRRGKRILLAEDNEVNQLVAVGVLEQAGYDVVVANDGREAIHLFERERERIDLILMDLQMPELGGLEAIRMIREKERGTEMRVPIIALTAHALREDRERCFAAGADGYVPKPLDEDELLGTIANLLDGNSPVSRRDEPFDVAAMRQRYATQPALLDKIVRVFERSIPKHIEKLREAVEKGDMESLYRTAHSIKGSVGTFGAKDATDLAARLEQAGRNRELGQANELLGRLEAEVSRLLVMLAAMREREVGAP